jgi:hypothetical protein
LGSAVRQLYKDGDFGVGQFIDKFAGAISEQMTRAYREGMRRAGVDPASMTDNEKAKLQNIIRKEENFVLEFAEEVINAKRSGQPVDPYISRVNTWATRYKDVANQATLEAAGDMPLKWVLGETEQHCASCARLNGIIKRASVWRAAGIQPQNPPNEKLKCGGWQCDCKLVPTDEKMTRGPLPRLTK